MRTLKERLTWARAERGLSQQELATKAGVSQGTIGNLESGIRSTARKITSIAEALNVDAAWLAEGKGLRPNLEPGAQPERRETQPVAATAPRLVQSARPGWMDESAFKLLELYWSLDNKKRTAAMAYLSAVAKDSAAGAASNDSK